jgi:hypothetical protein
MRATVTRRSSDAGAYWEKPHTSYCLIEHACHSADKSPLYCSAEIDNGPMTYGHASRSHPWPMYTSVQLRFRYAKPLGADE